MQVHKVFMSYTEGTALRVVILAGQRSFAAEQASLLENRLVSFRTTTVYGFLGFISLFHATTTT